MHLLQVLFINIFLVQTLIIHCSYNYCTSNSCFLSKSLSKVLLIFSASSVGIIHGSAQDSLQTVRAEINLFTNDLNEDGEEQLAKNWRFLDSKSQYLLYNV